MTAYKVFRFDEKAENWEFVGEAEAASSRGAITAALNGPATEFERQGSFVAVPARSWKPEKVQEKTALKFS